MRLKETEDAVMEVTEGVEVKKDLNISDREEVEQQSTTKQDGENINEN